MFEDLESTALFYMYMEGVRNSKKSYLDQTGIRIRMKH